MNLKKLNETKIYDNLTQPEKAQLLFKAIPEQDDTTFDKVVSSGESQSWIVRNHEARGLLNTMVDVALCWGVEYWHNQAKMAINLALTQSPKTDKYNEAMQEFKSLLILNESYLLVLDRLEADYGLSKQTVFNLCKVSIDLSPYEDFKSEMLPNSEQLLDDAVNHLYHNFSRVINKSLETISND